MSCFVQGRTIVKDGTQSECETVKKIIEVRNADFAHSSVCNELITRNEISDLC
jgi:hypothetical protein